MTDRIGRWAAESGYRGIRFLSVRALADDDLNQIAEDSTWDGWIGGYTGAWSDYLGDSDERLARLAAEDGYQNLVVFSGLDLATSIIRTRPSGHEWITNPHYRASINRLDSYYANRGWAEGSAFQRRMRSRTERRDIPPTYIGQYNTLEEPKVLM